MKPKEEKMLGAVYREIDKKTEELIVRIYGNWVREYNCIRYGEGCYSVVALVDNFPAGFISVYPRKLPEPFHEFCDAYIEVIEVHKEYRRRGIATELIKLAEAWAKEYGYRQISSWSSDDKKEALKMWYALDYGIMPAVMRGKSVIKEFENKPILGFYVSKMLNPSGKYLHP